MSRLRAFLALVLVGTWCLGAWHVELEAVGMMFEHEHRAHDDHDSDHVPVSAHDDHEQVFARDVAKDQVRANASSATWIALLAFATWLVTAARPTLAALKTLRQRRETDPPLAQAWQFVQRCAPDSAAPPALA